MCLQLQATCSGASGAMMSEKGQSAGGKKSSEGKDLVKSGLKKVVTGKLSLKGGAKGIAPTIDKKKKRVKKEQELTDAQMEKQLEEYLAQKEKDAKEGETEEVRDTRTKAEIQFEEAQRKRESELIKKRLAKTHRQRIEEYNEYLASLSEHHDIPKVGPG